MPYLIIVAGASGAGKSFLLEQIKTLDPSIVPVKKLTTRSPRPYENSGVRQYLDLLFDRGLEEVQKCDYRYHYATDWYGIPKGDIDRVLRSGHNPIVIVRNGATIQRLKQDYANVLVIYLQSGLSGDDLRSKLMSQGRSDLDIEERMRRHEDDFHDYVVHFHLFDYVIVNYYDKDPLIEQIQRVLDFALLSDITNPNFVFILMSFNNSLERTYKALRAAGKLITYRDLRVERVDAKLGDYKITEQVLDNIRSASLIVCDLTEERPNVYYELGYARGIGKTVIHCARKGTELHFDIKDFRTIIYEDPIDLQEKMVAEFQYHFPREDGH